MVWLGIARLISGVQLPPALPYSQQLADLQLIMLSIATNLQRGERFPTKKCGKKKLVV